MRFLLIAIITVVSAQPAWAGAHGAPKPENAAVIAGWSAPTLKAVWAIVLAPIEPKGGCYHYSDDDLVTIEDHAAVGGPVFQKLHRLPAGLYALVGVSWRQGDGVTTSWAGMTRQRGQAWSVKIEPGVVTDIGVWTIKSPYMQHFTIDAVDLEAGKAQAATLAQKDGALIVAEPSKVEVVKGTETCLSGNEPK